MKILSGDKYLHCFNGKVFSLQNIALESISYHIEESEVADIACDNKFIQVNCSNTFVGKIVLIACRYNTRITKIKDFCMVQHADNNIVFATYCFETFQIVDGYVCVTHKGVLYKITPEACIENTSYEAFQNFRLIHYAKQNEYALRVEYDDAELDCGLK